MTSDEQVPIRIRIEKDEPIEIAVLCKALLSLNNSIEEFISIQTGVSKVKTTLQSVEKGSDIFNLYIHAVSGVLAISEFLPTVNAYFDFFNNIKNINKKSIDDIREDRFLTTTAMQNLENIIDLAGTSGAKLEITGSTFNNCIFINANNKEIFKKGIETARKIRDEECKEQVKKVFEKMSITLYQTTNTDKKVKFKAYCYELSDKAIPILIDDDMLKLEILDNPYSYRFVCDLEIHKDAKGKISLYRAFNYIDKFEIIKD